MFDAACQYRDAGYSQSEAEAELIPRYVADGDGENPTAREREARASIASAYRRTARDPIPARDGGNGREMVEALSTRYKSTNPQRQHPTHAEVTEAVKACAHLSPVEWAEQRQRLKGLCGDGLRLTDLDRLYRQARRDLDRSRRQGLPETEGYAEVDGRMVFQRGTSERLTEQTMCLSVPSETFGDDAALRRFIAGKAGEEFTCRGHLSRPKTKNPVRQPNRSHNGAHAEPATR